ncbi:3-hydroxyacyl-CoA dehydrogenase family protein [Streptomyces sp. NPDC053367]|uniref:3-hydroxyacyl-CoA dehydrogenase family protein n=1 Tax=Streptomyces sp. NPDC053367 TaxID=3365700 RepID=UPI0037D81A39
MAPLFPTVAVIGLGTTGSLLVDLLARSGRRVIGLDTDPAALSRAQDRPSGAGVSCTTRYTDLAPAELVIEAVPERLATKGEVLARASGVCAPGTVLATTTSGLPVIDVAFAAGGAEHTVGLHLFARDRAGAPTAVEVVTTPMSRPSVAAAVRDLVADLGHTPVPVTDRAGFVGGALTMAYLNSAAVMYDQRFASRDSIDTAMTLGCGLPLGPLAQLDALGLDTVHDTLEALYERTGDRRYLPAPVLTHMVAAGLLGRKSGRGFYRYDGDTGADVGDDGAGLPPARPVRRVGVVGSGTMAAGIAEVCARAGHPVTLAARSEPKAKEAVAAVERSLHRAATRGRLTERDVSAALGRLTGAAGVDALADCDLVVEAVAEDLDAKRTVFAMLDSVCPPDAVLATSTSSLPVVACARATGRPEAVLGLHFFNPAPMMRLVEVAHTVLTSPGTLATAHAFTTSLGKRPVACRDRAGFIVNALLFPYLNSAVAMLDEGRATAEQIDTVMELGHGYPMGPLRLLDVIGLDVSLAIQHTLHRTFGEDHLEPARPLRRLVGAGHLGRKSGRGLRTSEA